MVSIDVAARLQRGAEPGWSLWYGRQTNGSDRSTSLAPIDPPADGPGSISPSGERLAYGPRGWRATGSRLGCGLGIEISRN